MGINLVFSENYFWSFWERCRGIMTKYGKELERINCSATYEPKLVDREKNYFDNLEKICIYDISRNKTITHKKMILMN